MSHFFLGVIGPLLHFAAVLALILLSGLCVAAEFSMVRVRRTRMEELLGELRDTRLDLN